MSGLRSTANRTRICLVMVVRNRDSNGASVLIVHPLIPTITNSKIQTSPTQLQAGPEAGAPLCALDHKTHERHQANTRGRPSPSNRQTTKPGTAGPEASAPPNQEQAGPEAGAPRWLHCSDCLAGGVIVRVFVIVIGARRGVGSVVNESKHAGLASGQDVQRFAHGAGA